MDNEKKLPINILSELEQAEATLVNLAPILASFYQALLKENVPDELARQLIRDYFIELMKKAGNA